MSNYKAITGSSKIVHRNQGGGSKLQGIPSSTNLNTWAHVAFRNRNVVCPCKREYIFCMNQLGGVGAGGIPGRSYAFAPGADGTHKYFYCGHSFGFKYKNNKHIIYPKKDSDGFTTIAKYPHVKLFYIYSNMKGLTYSDKLVVNNIYKVIINNKEVIFKVTKFSEYYTWSGYSYAIVIVNNGGINIGGLIYQSRYLFNGKTGKRIGEDKSFELLVKN